MRRSSQKRPENGVDFQMDSLTDGFWHVEHLPVFLLVEPCWRGAHVTRY